MKKKVKSKGKPLAKKKISKPVVEEKKAPLLGPESLGKKKAAPCKPKEFVPVVLQDFHRRTCLQLNRTSTHSHYVEMDNAGLTVERLPHEEFGRRFFKSLEEYDIKRAAARFLAYGASAGMTATAKAQLEHVTKHGTAPDVSTHIAERAAPTHLAAFVKRVNRDAPITWVTKKNPRQAGSGRHSRWQKYFGAKTVGEFLNRGGSLGDLRFDQSQGHLKTTEKG